MKLEFLLHTLKLSSTAISPRGGWKQTAERNRNEGKLRA